MKRLPLYVWFLILFIGGSIIANTYNVDHYIQSKIITGFKGALFWTAFIEAKRKFQDRRAKKKALANVGQAKDAA